MSFQEINTLKQALLDALPGLSSSEQRFTEILISNITMLSAYSLTEYSEQAGVSKSTGARCIRKLGFSSFEELREIGRKIQILNDSPLQRVEHSTNASYSLDSDIKKRWITHLNNEQSLQQKNAIEIDDLALKNFLTELNLTRKIWIYGIRNSYIGAYYLHVMLSHLLSNVELVSFDLGNMPTKISHMEAGDIFIAFDYPRRLHNTHQVLTFADQRNAQIYLFSDRFCNLPLSNIKNQFILKEHNGNTFNNYSSLVSFLNFLANEFTLQNPQTAMKRMSEIEETNSVMEIFDK